MGLLFSALEAITLVEYFEGCQKINAEIESDR